jgi:hypothetical protein
MLAIARGRHLGLLAGGSFFDRASFALSLFVLT